VLAARLLHGRHDRDLPCSSVGGSERLRPQPPGRLHPARIAEFQENMQQYSRIDSLREHEADSRPWAIRDQRGTEEILHRMGSSARKTPQLRALVRGLPQHARATRAWPTRRCACRTRSKHSRSLRRLEVSHRSSRQEALERSALPAWQWPRIAMRSTTPWARSSCMHCCWRSRRDASSGGLETIVDQATVQRIHLGCLTSPVKRDAPQHHRP